MHMSLSWHIASFRSKSHASDSHRSGEAAIFQGAPKFVAAQNAHDLKAVGELLQDSPQFLWITRGIPIWGRDAALKRFEALYQGTWSLDPKIDELRVTELQPGVVQLYVPMTFMISPAGQAAQPTRFLMNQVVVKTADGWKVSSILPIPAPQP